MTYIVDAELLMQKALVGKWTKIPGARKWRKVTGIYSYSDIDGDHLWELHFAGGMIKIIGAMDGIEVWEGENEPT